MIKKPIWITHKELWDTYRIGRFKCNELGRAGKIKVVRLQSSDSKTGKLHNRGKVLILAQSVDEYLESLIGKELADVN